ncbi:hypothetical protein Tco_0024416 [Tanacetum coccineum]
MWLTLCGMDASPGPSTPSKLAPELLHVPSHSPGTSSRPSHSPRYAQNLGMAECSNSTISQYDLHHVSTPTAAVQVKPSNEFEYEGEGSPTARAGVVVEGDGEEEGLELHKYEDVGWDVPGGFPRGIVRGRDRSFCGRGRENYNNAPFMDNQQEVGGYNQESPWGRGGYNFRGQGWGGYNNDSCVDNQQEAGVVDAIVVVVADGYADKQVAVVQAVREISVLVGEFLPSRACMTLASLKTTEEVRDLNLLQVALLVLDDVWSESCDEWESLVVSHSETRGVTRNDIITTQ